MRWVFIFAGVAVLGASTYMAVHAAGGLASESAPGLIGMALLLAVGSAAIGKALAGRHVGIAAVIAVGMLAGEVGAMVNTAQRVTNARSAMRAPAVELDAKRFEAQTRLDRAERGVAEANSEIAAKAALPGCKANCRQLLQDAKDAATHERDEARAALDAMPMAKGSQTALADATGWQQWVLDLVEALSVSLAINLPASALIALGVKLERRDGTNRQLPIVDVTYEVPKVVPKAITAVPEAVSDQKRNPKIEAERFGVAMLRPAPGSELSPGDIRTAYLEWCQAVGHVPMPTEQIAPALGRMFRNAGIETVNGLAVGVAVLRVS